MELNLNEGNRPSKYALNQLITGELPADESAALRSRLTSDDQTHLDQVEACRSMVTPLDLDGLRARSAQVAERTPTLPKPANRAWMVALVTLAAAAVLAVFAMPPSGQDVPSDYIGVRGNSLGLQVHQLDGDALRPHSDEVLGEGDVLGFKVDGRDRSSVVLLSVDGNGEVNVYWPERPGPAETLRGARNEALPGSLTLDDAPGPEVFIAVYDQPVQDAAQQARQIWQDGGAHGLMQWAYEREEVDAHWIERR